MFGAEQSYVNLVLTTLLLLFVKLTSAYTSNSHSTSQQSDPILLELYYKIGDSPLTDFKPRGTVKIKPAAEYKSPVVNLKQNKLSAQDIHNFNEAVKKGELYYLQARYNQSGSVVQSQVVLKSCSLVESKLKDFITVNLNINNEFLSINHHTDSSSCLNAKPLIDSLDTFETSLNIQPVSPGPSPETATYIKRLQEEITQKTKGEKADNRSFFGKYWMYIIPAVFILMFAGGPAPEQGSG